MPDFTEITIPSSALRDPVTGVCIDQLEIDLFNNTAEILIFDSLGVVELNSSAVQLATLRGTFGTQTQTIVQNLPLQTSFVIGHLKVVHYSGNALNDSNFQIKVYRADAFGKIRGEVIPIQEGANPRDKHPYILDFYGLDWLVDPFFALSFLTPLEGNFGISLTIKLIQSQLTAINYE